MKNSEDFEGKTSESSEFFLHKSMVFGLLLIPPAKGMHKGTFEAPVLSESELERRSKSISMGRRQA